MATMDERHATRGRGNALRLAITGQFGGNGPKWDDAETMKTLDVCLSCKACKTECPSNVDIARLKAEYTAQRCREHGTPLHARLFGHVRKLNALGSVAPEFANAVVKCSPVRALLQRLMNLSSHRALPPFATSLYSSFRASKLHDRPAVVLFADCFTTYNEPHIGHAAIAVLESLGYEVRLPRVNCCGRAMISTGLMEEATQTSARTLQTLIRETSDPRVIGVVVCEPSCLS